MNQENKEPSRQSQPLNEVPEAYTPPHKEGCREFLEDGTWWREYPNKQVIEVALDESQPGQING